MIKNWAHILAHYLPTHGFRTTKPQILKRKHLINNTSI
ncbi:unnamed protein product [Medioppia subpectinata]|uniref:Uncharacterized protein n=1 Tax=Medioppia subpectinata TaxID=1979941 RepID=A0A7R9KEI9_9ACAR|nr:unnamed protein product [Medioppia subpectinata]CAG2100676.1 unnamed protein product [Medioppia subpectinata]